MSSRLALGTVQFGVLYGVDKPTHAVSLAEASAIVARARELGLAMLDTAIAYGASEERLGEIGVDQWQVVSKLPSVPQGCTDVGAWLLEATRGSLRRLKRRKLYGLLLHDPGQLQGAQGDVIYRSLEALKFQGLTDKIGVSIYGPEELESLWPRFQFDLVQAPLNVLDRRLLASGWLGRLHAEGVEIHARSIFLQGLLLMPAASRPAYFNRWQPLWAAWEAWLDANGLTALQACLGFALAQSGLDRLVVGVNTVRNLEDIVANSRPWPAIPPQELTSSDPDLVNPSRWSVS